MDDLITHRQDGPVTVITFTTESLLKDTDIQSVKANIESIIERGGPGFVLDCAKLNYISSQAIAMFVNTRQKVMAKKGKLTLRRVGPLLMELIQITRLQKLFTIE